MKVLVTRPEAQSGPLMDALTARGDQPVALPLLAIDCFDQGASMDDLSLIKQQVTQLAHYHHVIFISTNAVEAAFYWIDQFWPQLPVLPCWYAIGKATARCLNDHDVAAQEAGLAMNSESLLQLDALQALEHQKVLIVRGKGGREHLREALEGRGAMVDYLEVYQRRSVRYEKGTLSALMQDGLDILTMSSGETIQGLLDQAMIDASCQQMLEIPAVVPGARLEKLARDHGFKHVFTAVNAGLDAMLTAIDEVKANKKLMRNQ